MRINCVLGPDFPGLWGRLAREGRQNGAEDASSMRLLASQAALIENLQFQRLVHLSKYPGLKPKRAFFPVGSH